MAEHIATGFVAECFWTGVSDDDLRALDQRVTAHIDHLTDDDPVRYLGSILMRADEVVLCVFEGSAAAVEHAARATGIPFERIVESTAIVGRASYGDGSRRGRPQPVTPDDRLEGGSR